MTANRFIATHKVLAPVFIGHEVYRHTGYTANHPLAIPRVAPVMDLCRALGWLRAGEFVTSPQASAEQLEWFHAPAYVRALQQADLTGVVAAEVRRSFAIGTMENPLFPGVYQRAATSVGGSMRAAELALEGRIAFHPAGGTHHGRRDRASGFCYFNDPVFAISCCCGAEQGGYCTWISMHITVMACRTHSSRTRVFTPCPCTNKAAGRIAALHPMPVAAGHAICRCRRGFATLNLRPS